MRIALDDLPDANLIRAYGEGRVRVNETDYREALLLSASELSTGWFDGPVSALRAEHLAPALALGPQVLLLGTGDRIVFPDPSVYRAVAEAGAGLEVMDTPAACRTYNILVAEHRRVVAALLL